MRDGSINKTNRLTKFCGSRGMLGFNTEQIQVRDLADKLFSSVGNLLCVTYLRTRTVPIMLHSHCPRTRPTPTRIKIRLCRILWRCSHCTERRMTPQFPIGFFEPFICICLGLTFALRQRECINASNISINTVNVAMVLAILLSLKIMKSLQNWL